ncbi:hypothetical protein WR25_24897 isoform F [Diploscapter pachys]|nr:hypothetical protein WR25_24897 isoform A [Diploscapter pachys]PAV85716.1 hypothetical protein WR25_24897 isoform B [Diploscapter pachys]PAV85720.1 hypothetical protein WR25_24897 isoform F [Diploscapter pachys]
MKGNPSHAGPSRPRDQSPAPDRKESAKEKMERLRKRILSDDSDSDQEPAGPSRRTDRKESAKEKMERLRKRILSDDSDSDQEPAGPSRRTEDESKENIAGEGTSQKKDPTLDDPESWKGASDRQLSDLSWKWIREHENDDAVKKAGCTFLEKRPASPNIGDIYEVETTTNQFTIYKKNGKANRWDKINVPKACIPPTSKNMSRYKKMLADNRKRHEKNKERNNARNRENYEDHKEERRQKSRKYYADHKDERQEYNRKYYADHKDERQEYNRKYNQEHKEERQEYRQKYNQEHKEERREYRQKYHANNKEEENQRSRDYHANHKEEENQRSRDYWEDNREEIIARRRWKYWHDAQFREDQLKKAWQRRQDKVVSELIHHLYAWLDMNRWRETGDFWSSICYIGRTMQRVETRWHQHRNFRLDDEENYKDLTKEKVAWIDGVMDGEIEAKIVYIGGLTEAEIELAEYSTVWETWRKFRRGTTLFNIQTPKIQALTRGQVEKLAKDFLGRLEKQPPSPSSSSSCSYRRPALPLSSSCPVSRRPVLPPVDVLPSSSQIQVWDGILVPVS